MSALMTPIAGHDFGTVSVAGGAVAATVTVTNDSGTTTLASLSLPGAGCTDFRATVAFRTLNGSDSAAISVSYDPSDRIADSCTVTIRDGASVSVGTFVLTGDGAAAVLMVDSTPLSFANQRWNGGLPETRQVVVMNIGEESTGVAAGLTNGTHFTRTPATRTIASGGMDTFDVTFDPTAASGTPFSDTLTLTADNDVPAAGNPTVAMSGIGTQSTQTFSASPFDVGSTPVGGTVTSSIGIGNSGAATLTLTGAPEAMTIGGANPSEFVFTDHACSGQTCNPSPNTVLAASTGNFAIRCTPAAAGTRTATLTVRSDDPGSPRTVTMTCTGLVPMLATSPASTMPAFATTQVGQPSATQNLVISNGAGAAPLTYSIVSNAAEFALSCAGGGGACLAGTVAAGGSVTVRVAFTPSTTGTRPGTLTIMSDDPDDSPRTINVSGNGALPAIAAAPSPLAFGDVPVALVGGATSALTLSNSGGAQLDVSSMTIDDASGSFSFAFGTCTSGQSCGQAVAVAAGGSSSTVVVRCDPASAGPKSGTLTLVSDAPSSPTVVNLTCTGTVPDVTVNPTALAFGNQRINTASAVQTFTVSNSNVAGTAPLAYTVSESSAHFSITCAPGCSGTLTQGQAAIVSVTFLPTATLLQMASIVVATPGDPDTMSTSVTVTGTGVHPLIELAAPMPTTPPVTGGVLAFGNVNNNATSPAQTITVRNPGSMSLSITGITNTNQEDFNLIGAAPTSLMPGQTVSWTVECDPETRGPKSGAIQVASDAENNGGAISVGLTCNSVEGLLVYTSSVPAPLTAGPTINFGPVRLMTMLATTVTVTNQGNAAATLSNLTLGSTVQGFSFTGFTANTVVAAGASTSFQVIFAPTLETQGSTTLTATSDWNDPVVTLVGTGQRTGCAMTPGPTFDLGSVRWDQTAVQTVTITNVGTAPFSITGVTKTGTNPTEFPISGLGTVPFTLAGGQSRQLTVTADPDNTMLGVRTATLVVASDLSAGMGCPTVGMRYVSVGPAVTVTPGMVVDFGGVDVDDADGVTVPVTITNSGDGPMTISGISAVAAPFSKPALGAAITVMPAATHTVMVTYRPTTERDPTMPETSSFVVDTTGLFAGGQVQPAGFTIMVRGHGIDRHIDVAGLAFPPTYRNPTATQVPTVTCGPARDQPCQLRVCNTGRATLDISMIDDPTDAFELAARGPFTVPGASATGEACMGVAVGFRPTSYGTFTGSLTIMNNDNGRAMVTVPITGDGIARPVMATPQVLDPVVIAVGVPVRLSELSPGGLLLVNPSATESFEVTAAATMPAVLDRDALTLAPLQSSGYDADLVATEAGVQTVVIEVFLDGDPVAHHALQFDAEVVAVDVHGGGCDSGGGQAGLLVGLVMVALIGGRRRGVVMLLGLIGGTAGVAQADESREVDIGTFAPTPSTEPGMFQVASPDVAGRDAWALSLAFSHATNPLVAEWTQQSASQELALVAARSQLELGFAYALTSKLELAVRVPMYQQAGGERLMSDPRGLTPADGFALGDVAVRAKANVVTGAVGFGGALEVTAPTGKDGQFAGVEMPTAHLQALLGGHARRVEWAVNGGFLARGVARYGQLEQGSELTFGAGVAVRVLEQVALVGETYGALGVVGAEGEVSPLEFSVGVRVRAGRALVVGLGGGGGVGRGIGVPDARGFLTLAIAPQARVPEPLRIVVPTPPRDTGDDDDDKVVNADDGCRTEPEDLDGFNDEDGCPDPDNDHDGLLDGDDRCGLEPEDPDGVEDTDGCIDADNDADGIPDVDDKCPNEPEDKDGFNDNDGCDEPDNDNDGVPDVLDQCALEPETINGNADEDGCPDKGDALVMLMQDRIEVLEPVTFVGQSARLGKGAARVLAQVGATMRAESGLKRVRVTVHVHPRGAGDTALSDKRAQEIRKWLIGWGVEPERVEAKGIGSQRPLVPNKQKGAGQINDRVEFIILERR